MYNFDLHTLDCNNGVEEASAAASRRRCDADTGEEKMEY
jgi:hypothetical protein